MSQKIELSLQKMLNFCAQKQKVLSKNIANIGTENYQREDIKFNDLLSENMRSPLKVTEAQHFPIGSMEEMTDEGFEIVKDQSKDMVSGQNNVDIDTEMAEMAENALKFRFASKKMGDYYKNLQNVIKGGSAS